MLNNTQTPEVIKQENSKVKRYNLVNHVMEKYGFSTYLEIGVAFGHSISLCFTVSSCSGQFAHSELGLRPNLNNLEFENMSPWTSRSSIFLCLVLVRDFRHLVHDNNSPGVIIVPILKRFIMLSSSLVLVSLISLLVKVVSLTKSNFLGYSSLDISSTLPGSELPIKPLIKLPSLGFNRNLSTVLNSGIVKCQTLGVLTRLWIAK